MIQLEFLTSSSQTWHLISSSGVSVWDLHLHNIFCKSYRGADESLARPGRKQSRKHVRDARDFNNIETRDVIKTFFLQVKAPKEIQAILIGTLACFLPVPVKDLSAPLYK
jgi:hypothetical protein